MHELTPAERLDRLIGTTRAAVIARKCGIADSNLSRYRYGQRQISAKDAERLAIFFQIPADCFTGSVSEGVRALARQAQGSTVRERLRWLITQANRVFGITPEDWADGTGITAGDIALFLHGDIPVSSRVLEHLFRATGIPVQPFVARELENEYAQPIAFARRLGISPSQVLLCIQEFARANLPK